ncbi:MAG TPA: cyclase dehydrase [Pseudolabrys sp.]|jgi:hypothetical protein|nr:cyclase dehydrase [Pseudolabrys sp.]
MDQMQTITVGHRQARNLARGLGWFSIGLGAAEILVPHAFTRWLGMRDGVALLQSYGARELLAGIGILASEKAAPWVWSRVGGDALDLATLAGGIRKDNPNNANIGIALAAVLGVTLADLVCAASLTEHERESRERTQRFVEAYSRRSGFPRPPDSMRGAAQRLDDSGGHDPAEPYLPYPTP